MKVFIFAILFLSCTSCACNRDLLPKQFDYHGNPIVLGGYTLEQLRAIRGEYKPIGMSVPDPDNYNSRKRELSYWHVPEGGWEKRCEWWPTLSFAY